MPEVRLIDANALKKDLSEFNYDMALRIVDTQPTIEAEPVRYANAIYIPNSKGYPSCSCCHEEMPLFLNFCPFCGAKMREGGADNA